MVRDMYVGMSREKGMFIVEPVEGVTQHDLIEQATGLKGGYTAGLQQIDLPEGADEVWVAWVETKLPGSGRLSFDFRAFPADMSEEEVESACREAEEEPLKVNKTQIHWAG